MSKYKVCVYAICKNEAQFVDRWVDSMNEADTIVVCDTGSSDATVQKLKDRGVFVYNITVSPWRFDVARNIALDLIPADVDICVSTDLDEILQTGWREKLEKVWMPETKRLKYMYTWNFLKDGSQGTTYWYDQIHSREGYRWVHPVHEVLKYYGHDEELCTNDATIQLNHYPDTSKPRSQYLPLLELSYKENPNDSSTVFWLGREYMFYGQYDNCIITLKKHLLLPTAEWDEERCASLRYIARCYKEKGNLIEAKRWLFRAIAECSSIREPYVDMARLGYELKEWLLVYYTVIEALKIQTKTTSYLGEASCWDSTIYDLGAIACYSLELFKKSHQFARIAVELSPNDPRLLNNLKLIIEKINQNEG